LRSLILDAYTRRLDRRSIRAEIRLQLNAFEAALGRAPDYIDGHQHVHQLPGVRAELLDELAARYRTDQQPWLRCTVPARREVDATPPASLPVGARLKAAIIASLGSALYYMVGQRHTSGAPDKRMARALAIRVGLSVTAFVLLMAGYYFGLIPAQR
jgi:hypothetical protein